MFEDAILSHLAVRLQRFKVIMRCQLSLKLGRRIERTLLCGNVKEATRNTEVIFIKETRLFIGGIILLKVMYIHKHVVKTIASIGNQILGQGLIQLGYF